MARRGQAVRRCQFRIVHGVLNRTAEPPGGRSYRHTCTLEAFGEVVQFIAQQAGKGVTMPLLWDQLNSVPCTQATVALEFLKNWGLVQIVRRRCFPALKQFSEEAMCEWDALARECENAR